MKSHFYIFIGIILLISCDGGKRDLEDDTIVSSSEEISTSNVFYNDVFSVTRSTVDYLEIKAQLKPGEASLEDNECGDVTYFLSQDSTYIQNITISYSDFSCSLVGRRKLGEIHIYMTGLLATEGTVVTVTLEDFYVEHHKIEGTQISTIKDVTGVKWGFEQKIKNGKITLPSGDFLLWESQKNIQIDFLSKLITQTGGSDGVTSQGTHFTSEIGSPLEESFSCNYIQKGVIVVELEDYNEFFIDYGTGECDDQAIVNYGNEFHTITMK